LINRGPEPRQGIHLNFRVREFSVDMLQIVILCVLGRYPNLVQV
jgi:hypothetical protein